MLKVRIIPTLLWSGTGLIKDVSFKSDRRIGAVEPALRVYNMREVDELVLSDITATSENRVPDYLSISEFSQNIFVPFTVGGGVSKIEHIKKLLRVGADKVLINSSAYENPSFIKEASQLFGAQCIVVGIDFSFIDGVYRCVKNSGAEVTEFDPVDWAKHMEEMGAGEILLTSIDNDGRMTGYDLKILGEVTKSVEIPVIISGGAGCYDDFRKAIVEGGASAVAAASMFHFTELTPLEAKDYLASYGIPIRNVNVIQ